MALPAMTRTPFYHFSVDDVFDAFIEVSDRRVPLFEHPLFGFLKRLHEEFGTIVSLYLFYEKPLDGRIRSLSEVSGSVRRSLMENPWLRLGPHALDYATAPYRQSAEEQIGVFDAIYAEVDRLAGGSATSEWVRLHYFSESYELAEYFRRRGVEALLLTDKEQGSYRLPADAREELKSRGFVEYGGMTLVRSHLRIETLVHDGVIGEHVAVLLEPILAAHGFAVIMTHEYELARPEVQAAAVALLDYLRRRGVRSV